MFKRMVLKRVLDEVGEIGKRYEKANCRVPIAITGKGAYVTG
jgi:hypothetical protein